MIIVFDSGSGGFSVLSRLNSLPCFYIADNLHVPYGELTLEEIKKFSSAVISWSLKRCDASCVVLACHTSSSIAIDEVKEVCGDIPVIEMIEPTVQFIKKHNFTKIGIIATKASVNSGFFAKRIKEFGINTEVQSVACPKLVPLIESMNYPAAKIVLYEYLQPLIDANIEVLILGCTHYSHVIDIIREILPNSVKIIDPAVHVASEVHRHYASSSLVSVGDKFYCTTLDVKLKVFADAYFKKKIEFNLAKVIFDKKDL